MSTVPLPRHPFGTSGLEVAPLGLAGSFGITADDVERAYHELGVNYFYVMARMKGLAEGVRRLVKAGHRDKIVIASGASIPFGFSVERAFRKQSKALGVEQIDVWHLFWVQANWYVTGKTWPAMRSLKERGAVRSLAISIHDRPMATRLVRELALDVLMIRYNAAHRGAEKEIFAPLGEDRPAIVAYTATRWGKLLKPRPGFDRPMDAGECYRFSIAHPSVDVVLCGARNFEELKHDAEAIARGPLDDARKTEVMKFGDAVRSGIYAMA